MANTHTHTHSDHSDVIFFKVKLFNSKASIMIFIQISTDYSTISLFDNLKLPKSKNQRDKKSEVEMHP